MAKLEVEYNCGCGFTTTKESEAVDHANKTGHTLSVLGAIKKERRQPLDIKALYQAKAEELALEKYDQDFYNLPNDTQLVLYNLAMEQVNDNLIS